jgi:hypothetical protein
MDAGRSKMDHDELAAAVSPQWKVSKERATINGRFGTANGVTAEDAASDTRQPHKDEARWAPRRTRVLIGSAAGLGATLIMSIVMWGFRRLGLMQHRAPPVEIVNRARRLTGDIGARRHFDATTAVAHLAFGAGAGALYGGVAPRRARLASGMVWGLAVWAMSYLQVLPALRLMPTPGRDESGRQVGIAVSHVAYGASLGVLSAALQRHREVQR